MEKKKLISKGELVVIVAIMGILGAILLPAFIRAGHSSRRSACVNNLKQLGLVLNMYSNENKDRFPPIDDTKHNFMFDADLLYPEYLADSAIAMCPGKKAYDPDRDFRLISNDYHLNSDISEVHADCITDESYNYLGFLVLNDLDAETFFKLYDDLSITDHEAVTYGISPSDGSGGGGSSVIPIMWDRPTQDPKGQNHKPAGGNVLYLDGHVEFHRHPGDFPITDKLAQLLDERKRAPIPGCDKAAGERRQIVRRFDDSTQSSLGLAPGVDRFLITDINTIYTGYAGGVTSNSAYLAPVQPGQSRPRPANTSSGVIRRSTAKIFDWTIADVFDEVWVVEASAAEPQPSRHYTDDLPTQGQLVALVDEVEVPVPLEHTEVTGQVSAFISSVDVKQTFYNPYGVKIEAQYVFPLPQNSAVTDFIMQVGDRRIRGIIREREEAREIYEQARDRGHVASLLTQERPNIFTEKVANIEPNKEIDITISYFGPLAYKDGEYEFVFPMVVGPRFNPPGSSDGVGSVGRGRYGASGQSTEVQTLAPRERSGHDIALALDIDAGVEIEKIRSTSHDVDVDRLSSSRVRVALSPKDTVPNRDFVLRYKVEGEQFKTAMLTHRGENGGTFALLLHPPESIEHLPRVAREMIFVVDCSGSMSGQPIAKVKKAMRRCLTMLDPNDTFQIIRFSDTASTFGRKPVPATPRNVRLGRDYINKLQANGGTMMINGIKQALDFPHDRERMRIVSFMTDGYIGNEAEILAAVKKKVGPARIFSFGVGSSVNRYLMEGMARLGNGAVAYVGLNEAAGKEVDLFYERVAHVALTDINIDWNGMRVSDVYPKRIPDMFVGRPIFVTGRFEGKVPAEVVVRGRAGYEDPAFVVQTDSDTSAAEHPGIESIWARAKIAELSDIEVSSPSRRLRNEITSTSLAYRLLCKYTAFVATDESEVTEGKYGVSVSVPVPVPDGVLYETAVQG